MLEHPAPWQRRTAPHAIYIADANGAPVATTLHDDVARAIEVLPDLQTAAERLLSRYGQFAIEVEWLRDELHDLRVALASSKGVTV